MSKNNRHNASLKDIISLQEASKESPYSQEYLSLLARRRKIFAKKIGRNWFTTRTALQEYIRQQSITISLPQLASVAPQQFLKPKKFGKPVLIASPYPLTPEEPDDAFAPPAASHEGHSQVYEEFERLNKEGSPVSSSANQPVAIRPQVTPPLPVLPPVRPFSLSPLFSGFRSQEKKKEKPASVESPVLEKLDRLSDSLSSFAERITESVTTAGPLAPDEKEFIGIELNSWHYRLARLNREGKDLLFHRHGLMAIVVSAIVLIFLLVGGFSFGNVDTVVAQIREAFKDADTVQGYFPGTHADEVLVLDKAGNISIFGHIETQGQLRSHAPNGVAPLVIDSITKIENLNADYLDNLNAQDFTLAYVTQNGNITYEDVKLEGNVEVGQTLTVKGALKLMSDLNVYGRLGVFSEAVFGKDVQLTGGNLIVKKGNIDIGSGNLRLGEGTIEINNRDMVRNLNSEFLQGKVPGDFTLDYVIGNGNETDRVAFFNGGLFGGDAGFTTIGVGGDAILGDAENKHKIHVTIFSQNFSVDKDGNLSAPGTATFNGLTVGNVKSDLIPSGSYELGSAGRPWEDLYVNDIFSNTASIGNFTISVLKAADGTAASPSITFADDLNTGFFRIGTDQLGVTASGTQRFQITSTGVSSSVNFEVSGAASASSIYGSGLVECTSVTLALRWNSTTGTFACGNVIGAAGSTLAIRESNGTFTNRSSLSYDAAHFVVTYPASTEALVKLDWGSGGPASLSENEVATGIWNFSNGVSVAQSFELTSGYASISNALFVNTGTGGRVGVKTVNPANALSIANGNQVGFESTTVGADDIGLTRSAAGKLKITNGGATNYFTFDGPGNQIIYGNAATDPAILFSGTNFYLTVANLMGIKGLHTGTVNVYASNFNTSQLLSRSHSNIGLMSAQSFYLTNGTGLLWAASEAGAADTGISKLAANKIGIGNGTAGNSSGTLVADNVGIGTTTPLTRLEVQGTASASNLFTVGSLQIGAGASPASESYNRLGISATTHSNYISANNDLLISGDLEVNGSAQFDSFLQVGTNTLYVNPTTGNVGIGTTSPGARLDVPGAYPIQARFPDGSVIAGNGPGIAFSSFSDTGISANNNNFGIWESGVLALALADTLKEFRVPSDYKFAFSAATNNNLPSDTSFYRTAADVLRTGGNFIVDRNLGIGTTTPLTRLEVQGTASASNLFTVGSLQVGSGASPASESYNRLGTSTTTHSNYISTNNDLLISGDLEVNGSAAFDALVAIGDATDGSDYVIVNSQIRSHLIPFDNSRELGSGTNRWRTVFTDKLDATEIVGSSTSFGGTNNETFTINADNASADAENSQFVFERGTPTTNAQLQWDSSNKRFYFNFPIFIQTADASEPALNFTKVTLKGTADQGSNDYFEIQNSSGNRLLIVEAGGRFIASGSFQAGGGSVASVSYSRFGASNTTHPNSISASDDLLISGDLEVNGQVYFDGTINFAGIASSSLFYADAGIAASPSFSFRIDQDTGMFRPTANELGFSTLGVERVRINSIGSVGIGTAPGAPLHVYDAGAGELARLAGNQGANDIGGYFSLYGGSVGIIPRGYIGYAKAGTGTPILFTSEIADYMEIRSESGLHMGTNGDNIRMTIDTNGNVGINDTTPDALLDVEGTASISGNFGIETSGFYYNATSNNVGIGTKSPTGKLQVIGGVDGSGNGAIRVTGTSGAGLSLENTGTDGRVWSVFSAPTGFSTDAGNFAIFDGTTPAYRFVIASVSGNVGLDGVTSPMANLSLGNDIQAKIHIYEGVAGNRWGIGMGGNDFQFFTRGNSGDFFSWRNGGDYNTNEIMRLDSNTGRLGINDTTPDALLDVEGTASISGNFGINLNKFYVNATTGNVGIGTKTPDALLDVTGNILASTSGNVDLIIKSTTAAGDEGKFILRSTGVSDRLEIMGGATPTSFVTIASLGNVGIGTTTPLSKLDVIGGDVRIGVTSSESLIFGNLTAPKQVSFGPEMITGAAASRRVVLWAGYSQDTEAQFMINNTGILEWGPGGSADQDIFLSRTGANQLTLTDTFAIASPSQAFPQILLTHTGKGIQFGSGSHNVDTQLFHDTATSSLTLQPLTRESTSTFAVKTSVGAEVFAIDTRNKRVRLTNQLLVNGADGGSGEAIDIVGLSGVPAIRVRHTATNQEIYAGFVTGDAQKRITIAANGEIRWGDGTSVTDTNLYRNAANVLRTEDSLIVDGDLTVGGNLSGGTSISGNFDPSTDNTYTLGDAIYRWKSLHLGPGSLDISSTTGTSGAGTDYTLGQISFSGSSLSFGTFDQGTGSGGSLDLKTASTSRLYITGGGNVGIGKTDPQAPLEVRKDATSAYATALRMTNLSGTTADTATGMDFVETSVNPAFVNASIRSRRTGAFDGTLEFLTAPDSSGVVERMRITPGGNVGINDTTPTAKLDVMGLGTSSPILQLQTDSATTDADFRFKISGPAGNYTSLMLEGETGGEGSGVFSTLVTVASQGNVGIGTTGPTEKLSVVSTARPAVSVGTSGNLQNVRLFQAIANRLDLSVNADFDGTNWVSDDATASTSLYIQIGGVHTWNSAAPGSPFTPVERMRIDDNGNVGIGTAAPARLLHLATTASASFVSLRGNNATGQAGVLEFYDTSSNNNWRIQMGDTSLDNALKISKGTFGGIGTEYLRIQDNGNVGIGTAGPSEKLEVVGAVVVDGTAAAFTDDGVIIDESVNEGRITAGSDGGNNRNLLLRATTAGIPDVNQLFLQYDGNVGIGTTAPSQTLHVAGTTRLTTSVAVTDDRTLCTIAASGEIEFVNGACGTSSRRYKQNIKDLGYGLEEIRKLNPVFFNYTKDASASSDLSIIDDRTKRRIGFIAEDMQAVIPEAVIWQNQQIESIDYAHLTALLTKGVQELDDTVASLSLRIDELEARSTSSSGNQNITVTQESLLDMLAQAAGVVFQKIRVTGDIIAQGAKKTYYSVAELWPDVDVATMAANWNTREITIDPLASSSDAGLFRGSGAQAAGQSKVDLVENGSYLATYGVDSTRGEIQLNGTADLINGNAKVFFDYSFSSIISDKIPLKVFITPTTSGVSGQLYVATKTIYGFEVQELNGASNGKFDWLVIARRKGYDADYQSILQGPTLQESSASAPSISPEPTISPEISPEVSPALSEPPPPSPETSPSPSPEVSIAPSPSPSVEPAPTPIELSPSLTPEPSIAPVASVSPSPTVESLPSSLPTPSSETSLVPTP